MCFWFYVAANAMNSINITSSAPSGRSSTSFHRVSFQFVWDILRLVWSPSLSHLLPLLRLLLLLHSTTNASGIQIDFFHSLTKRLFWMHTHITIARAFALFHCRRHCAHSHNFCLHWAFLFKQFAEQQNFAKFMRLRSLCCCTVNDVGCSC